MDTTEFPSSQIRLMLNDSKYLDGTFVSSDGSLLSEQGSCPESSDGSKSSPSLTTYVHHPTEGDLPLVGMQGNCAPSERCSRIGEETLNTSHVSSDAAGLDGTASFEKHEQHADFIDSETASVSKSATAGVKESSKAVNPYVEFGCSDNESHAEPPPTIDEPDKELMSSSDEQNPQNPKETLGVPEENRKELGLVVWREPAVNKSEIPSNISKPPPSEVTDLGDRFSYAKLHSAVRKSTIYDDKDDGEQHLALQDRLFKERVRIDDQAKGFFPRALLASLVTEDAVIKELTRTLNDTHTPSQIREYAQRICEERALPKEFDNRPSKIKSFRKIFAILVLVEKTSCISKFLELEGGVSDLDLPLVKIPKVASGSLFHLGKVPPPGLPKKRLECFHNWTQAPIAAFEYWQWATIAPFFHKGLRKDVQHYPLQNSVILPFVPPSVDDREERESNSRTEIEGGYGCVFKVKIHADHHDFDLLEHQCCAIKRLHSSNKKDFKKEVEMLKQFSDNAHPHLISLLATYEHLKKYYLIFPWADGDLTCFWKVQCPNPSFDSTKIKWVAKQCTGIAHGLVSIHNYQTSNLTSPNGIHQQRYGRHGDLKPENILWFDDPSGGMLKISDFGLSEYSTIHNRSSKPNSGLATSMSYRAPECDLKGSRIGPSYDIWTLGCLYLEFITWLLGGWDLVKAFEEKRMSPDPTYYNMRTDTFFELENRPNTEPGSIAARVKPAVTEFMLQLHEHSSCTEFLHNFINMVHYDMLLIKPKTREEKGRWSSEEVFRRTNEMLERCNTEPDYVCNPAPWCAYSPRVGEAPKINTTSSATVSVISRRFRYVEGQSQERFHPRLLSVTGRRASFRH